MLLLSKSFKPTVSGIVIVLLSAVVAVSSFVGNRPSFARVLQRMSSFTNDSEGMVIVVGSANLDVTTYTNQLPQLGETVMGNEVTESCGGKGANQAHAANVCGGAPTWFIGRLGTDSFGTSLQRNFDAVGVQYNRDTISTTDSHTGFAQITVNANSGNNCIIVIPGANYKLSARDVQTELTACLSNAVTAVVVTQLEIPVTVAMEAMKVAKSKGAVTILNPAPPPSDSDSIDYESIDYLIPNETELQALCSNLSTSTTTTSEEEMAKQLLQKGIRKAVIVTLGSRGAMIVSRHHNDQQQLEVTRVSTNEFNVDAALNTTVQDTVGAGDCFCGCLASYLSSTTVSLRDAVAKACTVASLSVQKQGAQSSYPRHETLPPILQRSNNQTQTKKTTITFVTGNPNKLKEVQALLTASSSTEALPFTIVNQKMEDLPEVQGSDAIEIAIEKCKLAYQNQQSPVLIEDTCLCFNELNGMPGPYVKWFLQKCGPDGLYKLLNSDYSAYAQTIVAITFDGIHVTTVDGITHGTIVPPKGPQTFGWDCIFKVGRKTYAEMTKDEKNKVSHRSKAFTKLISVLVNYREGDKH